MAVKAFQFSQYVGSRLNTKSIDFSNAPETSGAGHPDTNRLISCPTVFPGSRDGFGDEVQSKTLSSKSEYSWPIAIR
jgi:hypothetical protein